MSESPLHLGLSKPGCTWAHPRSDTGPSAPPSKQPLDEDERREWKAGLKLNIQKTKIMASSPITSWQIDGETMGTVRDFIFLGFRITGDSDCSHEIKRCLLLGRKAKAMTNLDSVLKSRDKQRGLSRQSYGFSSSHVRIRELNYKEGWVSKNWCFWTEVLEETL